MQQVSIHTSAEMQTGIASGQVRSFARLVTALQTAGWQIDWRLPEDPPLPFHIMDNAAPLGPGGLVLRRAYVAPYFRLERTNDRWNWEVAHATFPAHTFGQKAGLGLQRRLRAKMIGPHPVRRDGFIFMPLQGVLERARSFQTMSPLAMIEQTLAHDPRPIRATLHPRETYSPAERAALDALTRRFPRFTLDTASHPLLAACDLVVTQNSSLALAGFTANKPAVLFAEIDFHHIAGSVPHDGLPDAFARSTEPPPFSAYLHWFFRLNALDASAEDATDQFRNRLLALGWPMP